MATTGIANRGTAGQRPGLSMVMGQVNSPTLHRVCPQCGEDNEHRAASRYSRGRWHIKTCTACQFVYLEEALAYEELSTEHTWGDHWLAEKEFRLQRSPVQQALGEPFRRLKRWHQSLRQPKAVSLLSRLIGTGRVLEIGCGRGLLLTKLPQTLQPWGIEISERTAQSANERIQHRGGRVIHADALSGLRDLEPGSFHGLLMHSYLEHEIQPLDVLHEAARVLHPQGVLVIKVPNYACWNRIVLGDRWPGFRFPDHVNYFTPRSLTAMLARAGLQPRAAGWTDRLFTSDNFWTVAQRMR